MPPNARVSPRLPSQTIATISKPLRVSSSTPPNVILNRLAPDVVAQQVPIGYRILKQHEAQVSAPVGRIHQHDDPARLRGGIPPLERIQSPLYRPRRASIPLGELL